MSHPNFFVFALIQLHLVFVSARSYNLQVSGSDPIRIIEKEPLWDRAPQEMIVTRRPWSGVEHRALRTKQPETESEMEESTEASKELHEFLKNYADKLKRTRPLPAQPHYDSSEQFHKIELVTKPEEPSNRLANLLLNDKHIMVEKQKPKWNFLNSKKQSSTTHPTEEKKGWVSLEVVPWSVSQVAKWHSAVVKPQSQPKPSWQHSYNNNKQPFIYNTESQLSQRPILAEASDETDDKIYQQDYDVEIPRPTWTKPNQHNDEDSDYNNAAIITDGLPPNFPQYRPSQNRRKGFTDDDEHPITHPFNGDGEWVLVTTTKGYKASSKNKQRSRELEGNSEQQEGDTVRRHKSVRLTVLPPLSDSRINMTTSHGGLLQVESTFETVDEAQKSAERKEHMKKGHVKRKPYKRPQLTETLSANTAAPATNSKYKSPSPASVLAAVGAGMIPATMAMLVPMAMGKRRKRAILYRRKEPELPTQLRRLF